MKEPCREVGIIICVDVINACREFRILSGVEIGSYFSKFCAPNIAHPGIENDIMELDIADSLP